MVIAMTAVWMMQVTIYQIIYMITMWYGGVSAVRSMHMIRIMAGTLVVGCATIRVLRTHLQTVFIDMVIMDMMQMPVMNVIHMSIMFDRNMTAILAMLVGMVCMLLTAVCHKTAPFKTGLANQCAIHSPYTHWQSMTIGD